MEDILPISDLFFYRDEYEKFLAWQHWKPWPQKFLLYQPMQAACPEKYQWSFVAI